MHLDRLLTRAANDILEAIGEQRRAQVYWDPKLKSTAGTAWGLEVTLNPKLARVPMMIERIIRHELAHIISTLEHGAAWKDACRRLGIPDEETHHDIPELRIKVKRKYRYVCPRCGMTYDRVVKPTKQLACSRCCLQHNGGKYSRKFHLRLTRAAPKKGI